MNIVRALLNKINWYIVALILITAVICYLNYTPGTYLIGWDNLNPEFNWQLNFERALHGIWQEYQGLGLVAGMSHLADLPRQIILLPLIILFPLHLVRWVFLWLTLILGPIGMYYLVKNVFLKNTKNVNAKNAGAFIAALFYLLNLGTMQNFYAPIEIFTTQYALLPWLILLIAKCIEKSTPKRLLTLALISFFAAPMAITSTLFLPYAVIVTTIFITKLKPKDKERFKTLFKVGLVLIISNLFWVVPTAYSAFNKTDVVLNSKISNLVSDEVRDLNERDATFENFVVLKGFWFNNLDLDDEAQPFGYMLQEWRSHIDQPLVYGVGVIIFIGVVIGFIQILLSPVPYKSVIIISGVMALVMLLGEKPPTGYIFTLIRDSSDILNEIFRFPFTKFIIIAMFAFAASIGVFAHRLYALLDSKGLFSSKILSNILFTFIFAFPFIIIMLPAFQGHFVYEKMRQEVPDEYFEMFAWFDEKDDNGRILHLPMNTYLGWLYYDWGYRGSGFLWYGIKQPIIDRAFDVWSVENEGAYLEFSDAIYTGDEQEFNRLLRKYNVKYILFDKNVIDAGQNENALYQKETQQLVSSREDFFLSKEFEDIQIYEFRNDTNLAEIIENPLEVSDTYQWNFEDSIYHAYKDYIIKDLDEDFNYIYPFSSFEDRNGVEIVEEEGTYYLEYKVKTDQSLRLALDETIKPGEKSFVNVSTDLKDEVAFIDIERITPDLFVNGEEILELQPAVRSLSFEVDGNVEYIVIDNNIVDLVEDKIIDVEDSLSVQAYGDVTKYDMTSELSQEPVRECSGVLANGAEVDKLFANNTIQLSSRGGKACIILPLNDRLLSGNKYIADLSYEAVSDTGNRADICLRNGTTGECVYESDINNQEPIILDIEEGDVFWFEIFLDDIDKEDGLESVINYQNIELNIYEAVGNELESIEIPSPRYQSVNLENDDIFRVKLDQSIPNDIESALEYNLTRTEPYNCRLTTEDYSEVNTRKNFDEFGEYKEWYAVEASNCDFYSFDELPHQHNYLVRFEGYNIEGSQLRLYLQNNLNRRNNIIVDLDFKKDELNDWFVFLGPSAEDSKGYTFNIENRSIGTKPTTNRLYDIEIYPLDLNFLKSIVLIKDEYSENSTFRSIPIEKDSITSFTAFVNNLDEGEKSYLYFNQSYDSGWSAYRFNNKPNFIQKLFPSILGSKVGNHHKANNWANAWQIDDEGYYLITFEPQILQNLSIIFFAGTSLGLAYMIVRVKKIKQK